MKYRYPCTGIVGMEGFAAYLEENAKRPRHNIGAFASEIGAKFHAPYITLVNSGSSANLVAAMALAQNLTAQGKPLTAVAAAYTFPTTLSSLMMAGFSVHLVDTEESGFNLCPAALEKELSSAPVSLVCVTHFLGFPAQMDKIAPLARRHGALLLQDACETMDLNIKEGKPMHTLGDMTTWSFYHPHHLSSYGGGAVIASSPELHRMADSISHWGRACTCHIDEKTCAAPKGPSHNFTYVRQGMNVEMSELNACFGRYQFRKWDTIEQARKERYAVLFSALHSLPSVKIWPAVAGQGSPFVFPVACSSMTGEDAARLLGEKGIECRSLMGGAMVEQPAFAQLPHDGNKNARALARKSFFTGIHQTLPLDDVRTVADLMQQAFG